MSEEKILVTRTIPIEKFLLDSVHQKHNLVNERRKLVRAFALEQANYTAKLNGIEYKIELIDTEVNEAMKGNKTKVGKMLHQTNPGLNNQLSQFYPKLFKEFVTPADKIPKMVSTKDDSLICMRLIVSKTEKGKVVKITCREEFKTKGDRANHVQDHKNKGVLI